MLTVVMVVKCSTIDAGFATKNLGPCIHGRPWFKWILMSVSRFRLYSRGRVSKYLLDILEWHYCGGGNAWLCALSIQWLTCLINETMQTAAWTAGSPVLINGSSGRSHENSRIEYEGSSRWWRWWWWLNLDRSKQTNREISRFLHRILEHCLGCTWTWTRVRSLAFLHMHHLCVFPLWRYCLNKARRMHDPIIMTCVHCTTRFALKHTEQNKTRKWWRRRRSRKKLSTCKSIICKQKVYNRMRIEASE